MTAEEALAEVEKADERLRQLRQQLHQAKRGPISETIARLEREIAEETTSRDWLFEQM